VIRCRLHHLEERCRQRGYDLADAEACIVARHDGGTIDVDTEHPAYPRPRMGLGDMVAAGLSAVGITKERVARVLGKPCGCKERQAWLNEAGKRIGIGLPN
jgi:hypothetical protein